MFKNMKSTINKEKKSNEFQNRNAKILNLFLSKIPLNFSHFSKFYNQKFRLLESYFSSFLDFLKKILPSEKKFQI